jgi:hypothetical protein
MTSIPTEQQIKQALVDAAKAHHEFQENYLAGVRHEQWPFWYAAFVIGRLGKFISPTRLTRLLEEAPDNHHWFRGAAKYISENIKFS